MFLCDNRVIGVFNGFTEDRDTHIKKDARFSTQEFVESMDFDGARVQKRIYLPKNSEHSSKFKSDDGRVLGINSVGEGAINVCSENGNIEAGDYICSSSVPGKGMKQDDDLLHSYTVAKALESVDWEKEETSVKMIACTYHCG